MITIMESHDLTGVKCSIDMSQRDSTAKVPSTAEVNGEKLSMVLSQHSAGRCAHPRTSRARHGADLAVVGLRRPAVRDLHTLSHLAWPHPRAGRLRLMVTRDLWH